MQTPLRVCKLYLLLCLGLLVNTSPILNNIKTTAADYQQSGSSFHHESSYSSYPRYENMEIKSNLQQAFPVDQSLQNVPSSTKTFRDQNGNLVTQVKKEIFNNENGQNSHAFEFKEEKQLPNGYSKSFKKEYSSSSVTGSEPTTFIQNPLNLDKSYNNEKLFHEESSIFGESSQNSQGSLMSGNTNYVGFKPNLKFTISQSKTNLPATTVTDRYGNLITQVPNEVVSNNKGQNSQVFEFEEVKQLPNRFANSFKKEYSSSSVTGSQPIELTQNPINVEKYYNSEQKLQGASSTLEQSLQNQHVSSIPSNTGYVGIDSNSKSSVVQSLSNVPGVTSTFRDQYGNLVTQVTKEVVNNNNGQNSHAFEFEETKQLPNGYAKSFKKEYSSSSVTGSQPIELSQNPIKVEKYYNSEQKLQGASSTLEQSLQNQHVSSIPSNTGYVGIDSNSKSSVVQSLSNVPGVTSTFRDQYGNLVTQVTKEVVNNNNGQNSHAFEFEETKQLPNGYAKSFKKEYSSSSVTGSQPIELSQNPIKVEKYYNSEQKLQGASSTLEQSLQNQHVSSIPSNTGYVGIDSNSKSSVVQSLSNVPGVTSTFRDQYGNLVTQVKKEVVNNNNGQNSHAFEFEETKQLPNGYAKSFKKEYSSSSVTGSQPIELSQNPINIEKYYNSEQKLQGASSTLEQSLQNQHVSSIPSNTGYVGIDSNSKSSVVQNLSNVPGVTSTFRDQYGNLVTQVKKEVVNNNNGQNSHAFEFEETKQLPNGYAKSFKKEYSSSSVTGSQPIELSQNPINIEKYFNEQKLQGASSILEQSLQNQYVSSKPSKTGYVGIDSNSKSSVVQSLSNVPAVTSTFRDQYGNLVTQVKKEVVNNNNGQNSHAFEFEEAKQLPNGYAKSFKKEYSSSSVISSNPILEKDTTEKKTLSSQKFSHGETEKLNGYNTFFNNQKYPLNLNGPSNSQSIDNQKSINTHSSSVVNSFGFNTKNQTDCDENDSFNSNTVTKPLPIGQASVNIDYLSKPKEPVRQQSENIESFSTQTREETGQKSVDLHEFSNPSPIGQASISIDNLSKPKAPVGQQSEKIELFSTQTREETGQKSVDLHEFSNPSPIGQASVNIDYLSKSKEPVRQQSEKTESFSTQTREETGQKSVDLHEFSNSSPIGQASVNIDNLSKPKAPVGQQSEKIELFSTQTREETGQKSVDLHEFSNHSPIGQASAHMDYLSKPKAPVRQQSEKIESFSTQTREELGQKSVDLHEFSNPSFIGQASVNIDYLSKPKEPVRQQSEKIESFSTQTREETGQKSVDLHEFSNPSPIGQASVNIDYLSKPKAPIRQQSEKIELFSTQTREEVGQKSVDSHEFTKPSPIGQESVNINNFFIPTNPTGQQYEKVQTSYQNKYDSEGKYYMNNNENGKSSLHGKTQQSISQPITGQQIHGLEFLTSNYGDTTHVLDLGAIGQKPTGDSNFSPQNINNGYILASNKPTGQQTVGVFEKQSTIEKNIDTHGSDYLPTNVNSYQENVYVNHQKLQGQSMKSPVLQGQQTIDFTNDLKKHRPIYQNQNYGNIGFQKSEFSSHTGKLVTGNIDQPITTKYNNIVDKLDQLEHEVLGAKSTVNMDKDNFQTSYSTNHNVKSMPLKNYQQQSHFLKTTNENTQYIEPESEIISKTNGGKVSSSNSFIDERRSIVQDSAHENHSLEHIFPEQLTTPSSVWKKIGDKVKGTIQNAKTKAQQAVSTIQDKVGFSKDNTNENTH